MTEPLVGKHVVLGVSGSIAAFKAVQLASDLVKIGALVDVVMTESATRFVAPLSFQAITHRPVLTDLWAASAELEIGHVTLGRRADVVVVAPATAATLARLANGLSDDGIGTTVLSSTAPLILAPAMEPRMWAHLATARNVARLRADGATVLEPASGRMASGHVGQGRMPEPTTIVQAIRDAFDRTRASTSGSLAGKHVVVTAGGTREPIDPVRFIGNRSSGKMGIAIAESARDHGARVTLVAGHIEVPIPSGVAVVRVESTLELQSALRTAIGDADALVMAAAPADFRVETFSDRKIKREFGGGELRLVANPDILASLSDWRGIKIGFAAETNDVLANAQKKVVAKSVDAIVANDVSAEGSGFGVDTNQVTIVHRDGRVEALPLLTKNEVADRLIGLVAELLARR